MAQTAVARQYQQTVEKWPGSIFAFAWRESARHQPWLCVCWRRRSSRSPWYRSNCSGGSSIARSVIRTSELLFWLGAIYLGTVLLQGGLKYLLRVYRALVSERATLHLRRAAHGQNRHDEQGETVSIVASEVERVGGLVGEAFSEPILQGGILVVVLGYMLVVEPTIALVSLCFFVPQILLVPLIQRFINRRALRKVELVRELGGQIVASVGHDHYDRTASRVLGVRMSYYRWKFLSKLLTNFMNHLAPLSVLVVGGYMVINGETTVGTIVAFISGFERMADPSRQLIAYYRLASESQVQYRLIADRLAD